MTRDDLDGELADCVFDRAAYVAVPKSLRRRYAEAVTGLCSLNFRCLMITEVYDDKRFDIGPPFCAKLEDLQESFQGNHIWKRNNGEGLNFVSVWCQVRMSLFLKKWTIQL